MNREVVKETGRLVAENVNLRAERDRLREALSDTAQTLGAFREALTWALGYIEYADVIPSHRDVREGKNDRVLYERAVDALDPERTDRASSVHGLSVVGPGEPRGHAVTYRHTPEPALAKYVQGVEAERDRLRDSLERIARLDPMDPDSGGWAKTEAMIALDPRSTPATSRALIVVPSRSLRRPSMIATPPLSCTSPRGRSSPPSSRPCERAASSTLERKTNMTGGSGSSSSVITATNVRTEDSMRVGVIVSRDSIEIGGWAFSRHDLLMAIGAEPDE